MFSFRRIVEHLRQRELERPKILIVGNQGYIGKKLQELLQLKEYDVVGYDIKVRRLPEEGLEVFDVIIGTTGIPSITELEIVRTKETVSLISLSSSDREFPTLLFRKEGTNLHQDHYLGQRCLVNSGFPITFYGNYHELPPNQIEITCSLLLLGVFKASLNNEDYRTQGSQFTAAIVDRLKTMYFQQLSEKDYVYEL